MNMLHKPNGRQRRRHIQAQRSMTNARYSILTWAFETRALIMREIERYPWCPILRYVFVPRDQDTLEVNLHSDRLFRKFGQENSSANQEAIEREEPATLIVSVHLNGTVHLHASGPSSSHGSPDTTGLTLGLYEATWALAGLSGIKIIRRHLADFERFTLGALTEVAPTKQHASFMTKLERRSDRYRFVHSDSATARRERISKEVALAAGLATGLISSTIFPLLVVLGEAARKKANDISATCNQTSMFLRDRCYEVRGYGLSEGFGALFTPELILIASLTLSVCAFASIRHYMRQR